jgi:phage recombination protein Bet
MNAESTEVIRDVNLPAPVAKRGITESQWMTLRTSLFPGAKPESVLMAWDYCKARGLDPLKKPCHIVPMNVKNAQTGHYDWRDVIMPGIYEYRTTAHRTGEYLGHSIPEYGPDEDFKGVLAPSWCAITVYRWNDRAKMRAEYPVRIEFKEICATKRDGTPNDRWSTAPKMQLTKCTEAAGLREGFPEELGGTHTVEEMEGRVIDVTPEPSIDPRPDTSDVDYTLRDKHVSAIADIVAEFGSDEAALSHVLKDYIATHLQAFHELYTVVYDQVAKEGIISKSAWKKLAK